MEAPESTIPRRSRSDPGRSLRASLSRAAGLALPLGGLGLAAAAAAVGASIVATPGVAVAEAHFDHVETEATARAVLFGADRAPSVDAASWDASEQPVVRIRSRGAAVERLQLRLAELGYDAGTPDGQFGRGVRTAVLEFQFDRFGEADGIVGPGTWAALAVAQDHRPAAPTTTPGGQPLLTRYAPGSAQAIALFEEAAAAAGVPVSWARSDALHELLAAESDGRVGRPNYTYGRRSRNTSHWREVHAEVRAGLRTTSSTATGLGQLLIANVDRHYPSGRAGIGDAFEEAVGMLKYIQDRHDTPERAWSRYNSAHEGY